MINSQEKMIKWPYVPPIEHRCIVGLAKVKGVSLPDQPYPACTCQNLVLPFLVSVEGNYLILGALQGAAIIKAD
jgi:hypothetical protein